MAHLPVNHKISDYDLLHGSIIPRIGWRCLVVPDVVAGIRIERHYGGQEQVIPAAGAADFGRPGRTVAHAYQQQVRDRIVYDRVPHGSTTTRQPPLAIPGCSSYFHLRIFKSVRRITRYGVPDPVAV